MEPPVLLDENVDHEVLHRLRNYGYTVEHIGLHHHLEKGTRIAYSPSTPDQTKPSS